MQNEVTVQVSNPNQIRLSVTAEMTLPEWQEIVKMIEAANDKEGKPIRLHLPLLQLLNGISSGIRNVTRREGISGEGLP